MKKKILITGAAGFIGYNILTFLEKKNNVKGLDNFIVKDTKFKKKNYKNIIDCNILDKKKIKKIVEKFDVIIHLAAIQNPKFIKRNPEKTFDINFNGTRNIVDNLRSNQLFIYFSSNIVYGNIKKYPITENSSTKPNEIYGISKLISEKYIKISSEYNKFKYFIIRNFNTFGPYQGNNSYIPTLINSGLKNDNFEIWNPNKIRDLQYIDDLCNNINSLIQISKKKNNIIINAASGNSYSPNHIAKIIGKEIKKNFVVKDNQKKNIELNVKKIVNIEKFKEILRGKYKVSNFKKSLQKTVKFYKLNYD